jgi:hypothetical protein
MNNLEESVKNLIKALKSDESYRNTWLANLSMATFDELPDCLDYKYRLKISHAAAIRFLGWLCVEPDTSARETGETLDPLQARTNIEPIGG